MPHLRAYIRRWIEPPRHLLVALAAVTVASAVAFGWLGWEMLRRDEAVEAQREQERLAYQADRTVQAIERLLAATEERLAAWVTRPSLQTPESPDGGLVVTFTPTSIATSGTSRLLFRPYVPPSAEPPPSLFADGETAEFLSRDLREAAVVFERLARSSDPSVRAAALLRLGRVERASARHQDAIGTYTRMTALGDVRVAGLPADLLARAARVHVLADMGDSGRARDEARAILDDLARARWALTRGQYEFYRDDAAAVAGVDAAPHKTDLAMALAVEDLWQRSREGLPTAGRRSMRVDDGALLVTWRAAEDRVAAWVLPADQLLQRVPSDASLAIALRDHDGSPVAGVLDGPGRDALRMPADTGLPWVLQVRRAAGDLPGSTFTRGRLTVLGIAVMSLFLVTGVYFIGRAVRREMELARLHTDFVAAVSHEFRGEVSQAACRVDIADAADCGRVLADPDAVGLALHNLLDNAVKYAGADARVDVSWERQGARIGLRVRDHGPGVPPEERARIFERFVRGSAATTARVRGTGIGLALVKQIAAGHGGDVAVDPAPDAGSVFTIWLPVAGDVP